MPHIKFFPYAPNFVGPALAVIMVDMSSNSLVNFYYFWWCLLMASE